MTKKRGQGEGSICQRADGRWVARVTLPDGGRKAHYGKTAKEACEKLKQAQSELEQGIVLRKSGRLTVGQFLDDWLGWLKASEAVKARTWESYESICRVRVPAEVRMILLAKLQLADLQNLYAALKARGLSTRSIQHTHRSSIPPSATRSIKV